MRAWYLEGYLSEEETLRRLPVNSFPFQVGRNRDVKLCLPTHDVSRCHAEIEHREDKLVVRDLGSTNGTYVNGGRVDSEVVLIEGDVIHFGHSEFRLVGETLDNSATVAMACVSSEHPALPDKLIRGTRELHELITQSKASGVFQPIVESNSELAVAHEVLGRGTHPDLTPSPAVLFMLAEHINSEVTLSELFRRACLALAYAHDFGIEVLAEGVETASEAAVCRDLGFDLMQGYFYGKPACDL